MNVEVDNNDELGLLSQEVKDLETELVKVKSDYVTKFQDASLLVRIIELTNSLVVNTFVFSYHI